MRWQDKSCGRMDRCDQGKDKIKDQIVVLLLSGQGSKTESNGRS